MEFKLDPLLAHIKNKLFVRILYEAKIDKKISILKTDFYNEAVEKEPILRSNRFGGSKITYIEKNQTIINDSIEIKSPRERLVVDDILNLTDKYQAIISLSTIDHTSFDIHKNCLVKLIHLLEPQGRMVIAYHNRRNFIARIQCLFFKDIFFYKESALEKVFKHENINIVKKDYFFMTIPGFRILRWKYKDHNKLVEKFLAIEKILKKIYLSHLFGSFVYYIVDNTDEGI